MKNDNNLRKMHTTFEKLRDEVYELVLNQYSAGAPLDDLLEEDIELCNHFCDKIVAVLVGGKSKAELLSVLSSGDSIYDHFKFEGDEVWANSVIDIMIKLQPELQKYATLASEEKNDIQQKR
ncbi:MAG: hypothetical protein LBB34_02540 [Holosporales bacterium]|jgi:hypothetical protein|nr:hypothetical protein [Holosporales bacterium]